MDKMLPQSIWATTETVSDGGAADATQTNLTEALHLSTPRFNETFYDSDNESLLFDGYRDGNYTLCNDSNENQYFNVIVYIMYISIFLAALFGNGIICFIIQSLPRMRTVTNYFIANLAVGDILMSLFCIPLSFISLFILYYWPFGSATCKLVSYSQAVSVFVSAYTLVAISLDRYISLMWPLRPRVTKRQAKYIIVVVWTIALTIALPIPIFSVLYQPKGGYHEKCNKYVCTEIWEDEVSRYIYTVVVITFQFIVPVAVLIFTYTRIAIAIWGKRPPGEAENSRDKRMARSKRKMIKMMVMVVIMFIMCWLPFNTLTMLLHIFNEINNWMPLQYVWFAFHWLAMSHSCCNPIIYCYMHSKFRIAFLQILYRIPGLRKCYWFQQCVRRSGTVGPGFALTGNDDISHLHRVNTCTTYISTRKKAKLTMPEANC